MRILFPEASTTTAWAELTTLGSRFERRAVILAAGQREGLLRDVVPGRVMLCHGGESLTTHCVQLDVEPGVVVELPAIEGVDLVGRFVQGDSPMAARVALAPADLQVPMTFTLPLAAKGYELQREVETDRALRFRVPRLAPGEYLLEAELASGRIYRSETITVPSPEELRRGREARETSTTPVYHLGDLLVASGLTVEFLVTDVWGRPLRGATVGYSQQTAPMRSQSFKSETDGDGRARVSGIDAGLAGRAICRKDGYLFVRRAFDLPPVHIECALEPLTRLTGQVVDADGVGIAMATVTLRPSDPVDGRGRDRDTTDPDGFFAFGDLPAGEHELIVAAPGFGAERLIVALEPGEALELDAIALLPGRELWGVVVDADSEEPVAGVTVEIDRPAGAGSTITDEDGEFRLTTDSERALWLRVASEHHARRRFEVAPSRLDAEEPFEVRLSTGGRILAEVFDEDTGLPCEGCRVLFGAASGGSTGAEGRALSEPLDPGAHAVSLERVQSRGSLIVRESGREVKMVNVRSGETATVRFGEPKTILEVAFDRPLPTGWNLATRGTSLGYYHVEADGVFRIRWRPGELTELLLSEAGPGIGRRTWLGVVPPDHGASRLELELSDTLVTGQILVGETPAGGRAVELRSLVDSRGRAWARSDAGGGFALPFVAPGSYALFVDERMVQVVTVRRNRPESLSEIRLPSSVVEGGSGP